MVMLLAASRPFGLAIVPDPPNPDAVTNAALVNPFSSRPREPPPRAAGWMLALLVMRATATRA
jgi:hypothetical protein